MTTAAATARSSGERWGRERSKELVWRLVQDGARSGSTNMALDHALARSAAERGEGVLRLYRWARPTVSFGRNEPALGLYSAERARERGIDFVRRPTGGRAVLHSDELTYSVAVPIRRFLGARELYRRVNEALAEALRALGVPAVLAEGGAPAAPDAGPCFGSAARGEVLARGRKLVGSAQARLDGALLQHGSILISDDQAGLVDLGSVDPVPRRPAVLREMVSERDDSALRDAIAESVRDGLGGRWRGAEPDAGEMELTRELEGWRYGVDSWTWRR